MKSVEEGSFWDHLEELRQRLIAVLASIGVATIAAFFFSRRLVAFLLSRGPDALLALAPSEALVTHLKVALLAGILVSSPVLFYNFWKFLAPGLYERERRFLLVASCFCSVLFVGGALFAWFLMLEPVIDLFQSFEEGSIAGGWSVSSYIGFLSRFVLVFALAFELPVVVVLLVRMRILRPSTISSYRKHIIVALLVSAALLTPPDPLTQVMLAMPLYVLFELSVLLARLFGVGGREQRPRAH